jgi:hypothetical protein
MLKRLKIAPVFAAALLVMGAGAALAASSGAPTGGKCGGIGAIKCEGADDFCKMKTGACRQPDAMGVCTRKPQVCPMQSKDKPKVVAPVCGCNGETYGNSCEADHAGENIASNGKCKPKH